MATARKRPRVENEDNRAECPFTIRIVDSKDKGPKKNKRRRMSGIDDDDTEKKANLQMSPFAPSGKFKTYETMDLHYQVDVAKEWTDMTRYNSFVLNGAKYFSEGFIYVANDSSIERQKAATNNDPMQPRKKSEDDWVARILEIRASDEHHVYARIYWMYWPDELPPGTHDGKKLVQGRQPYHGLNELIASNHMDIINVVSVTSQATVKQWYEENDDEIQSSLYWRQAFDVRTYELSAVDLVCSCKTPEHPDKILVGCTSETCKIWMHEQCIIDQALKATYDRLGTDKPHRPPSAIKEEEKVGEETQRLLSPTETGASVATQQSIDVKPSVDGVPSENIHVSGDHVDVKQQPEDEDAPGAPEDAIVDAPVDTRTAQPKTNSEPRSKGASTPKTASTRKVGRLRKSNGVASRPWEGLFSVVLRTEATPPMLEFEDLRVGLQGGEKSWTEPIKCLSCGSEIN